MVSSDPPRLKVTVEGGTAPASEFLFENWFRIGRHTNCQVQLVGREVSRVHADVFIDDGRWWLQDLESANGVFVEGRKIELKEAMAHAADKKDLEKRFRNGLSISSDPGGGDRFRVVDVKPNSPAFFAGLKRGTLIFEIDGRPATAYSLDEARRALRADGTHPLSVSDSSGRKVKINLELPSL